MAGGAALLALLCFLIIRARTAPSAALTLPNGSTGTIVAVTVGTNHVVGSALERAIARLPARGQALITRIIGRRAVPMHIRVTSTPSLVIWMKWTPAVASNQTSHTFMLADEHGFVSGESAYHWPAAVVEPLTFGAFPRRARHFELRAYAQDPSHEPKQCGSVIVRNPVTSFHGHWKAEPLPATKQAGDMEMRLEMVETAHNNSTTHQAGPGRTVKVTHGLQRPGEVNQTVCSLELRSLADTNQIWRVSGVRVSDATGNTIASTSSSWNEKEFRFSPSLWPQGEVWRLAFQVKREQGFAPQEKIVFKDLPLGALNATNLLNLRTNVAVPGPASIPAGAVGTNGLAITLHHIYRRAPGTNQNWSSGELTHIKLTHSPLPDDIHLDLISVVADTGETLQSPSWGRGGDERTWYFRSVPLNARTADFTFALQRGRTVEFLVAPKIARANGE